jgi:hypothetical protein
MAEFYDSDITSDEDVDSVTSTDKDVADGTLSDSFDDELERLAQINARLNANQPSETTVQSKGKQFSS